MNEDLITLSGKSGTAYTFTVYSYNVTFNSVSAVYLVTNRELNGVTHKLIYLGITEDMAARFNGHHKESCFTKNKATNISVLREDNDKRREQIEKDILAKYNFSCNEMNN